MAHFALLGENNRVINVVKVIDEVLLDENGNEDEQKGIDFLNSCSGKNERWVKTSYNSNFRKRFALIGGTYNEEHDVFVRPKPLGCETWVLNTNDYEWEAPVPKPSERQGYDYIWNDSIVNWVEIRVPDPRPIEDPDEGNYWHLNEYSWEQLPVPSAPSETPEDGYEWKFDFIGGLWVQAEIQ